MYSKGNADLVDQFHLVIHHVLGHHCFLEVQVVQGTLVVPALQADHPVQGNQGFHYHL